MDIIGEKRFEINDKYFFSDTGLMHSIIPFTGSQTGGVFENLVYNQLITEDYNVFIGKHQDREIDFVAIKGNEIKYVQVAYRLPDEFASDYKGIRHMHIRMFLNSEA